MMVGRGQKGLIGHAASAIAATSIAKRISEEMGAEVGQVAGYKIRFKDELEPRRNDQINDRRHPAGRDSSATDCLKPTIRSLSTRAHERSLNIDFLLGYLREILPKRPDLKLIITSRRLTRSDLPSILRTSIRSPFRLIVSGPSLSGPSSLSSGPRRRKRK